MHSGNLGLRGLVIAAVSLSIVLASCGHSSQSVAPSALASNPSNYDDQDVTVSGTAKNPTTRQMRRGKVTIYQLCDSSCVNVVQFGDTNVTDGSSVTVSGRFRTSFGRRMHMSNVVIVGGRMRPQGGGSP
jgi:FlaG/FlaF family flagellin (archaellin)